MNFLSVGRPFSVAENHPRNPGQLVSSIRNKLSSLLVESLNDALNCVDFALLEVRLTTLVTDPSRDRVEHQVIAVAVDVEGCLRALHLPMTVNTVHFVRSRHLANCMRKKKYAFVRHRQAVPVWLFLCRGRVRPG